VFVHVGYVRIHQHKVKLTTTPLIYERTLQTNVATDAMSTKFYLPLTNPESEVFHNEINECQQYSVSSINKWCNIPLHS